MNPGSRNAGLAYREAAVAGASPVRLVVLLYEQAMENLRRALAAHMRQDIEGRTREINHALLVIGHLQATLDKEQGGKVAENLTRFYEQLRAGLVEAQCKQSAEVLERQISHLMQVYEAWCAVEKSLAPPPPAATAQSHGESPSSEWNA
jgi:flagellar secretion chaperone FliS